ncbi:hypothetical protein G4B88_000860 [Cannabis sativa]|nr:hypothetical protein G4B88_000860 [Cannabis sativa]
MENKAQQYVCVVFNTWEKPLMSFEFFSKQVQYFNTKQRKRKRMYKSKLQELCHKNQWGLPKYTSMRYGPDHNPLFGASV